jgi:predicted component of type VI protein secretion system
VYVPNEYTLFLSSSDRAQFAAYEGSLVGELQEYLVEHARREGYALLTPPRVLLQTDDDLAMGEFGIATRVVQAEEARAAVAVQLPAPTPAAPPVPVPAAPLPEPPAATMVYRPETPLGENDGPPPEVVRERVTLTVDGRVVPLTTSRVVVGRSRECDIRVDDGNVSRRHCEVAQDGPTAWSVVDLGSTNGTEVNGKRVSGKQRLDDGDRIVIGGTELVFGRSRS